MNRRPSPSEAIEAAKRELDELLVAARSAAERVENAIEEVTGVGRRLRNFARKFWSGRWVE